MILKADRDTFGNIENMTSTALRNILDLLDCYMDGKDYTIQEIRIDDVNDPHGRVDIEIRTTDSRKCLYQQKLLILNNEVIDGITFHERYREWYKN